MTLREWTLKLEEMTRVDRRLCRDFIDAFIAEMARQLAEDRECRIPSLGTLKITKDKVGMLGAGFKFLPSGGFAEKVNNGKCDVPPAGWTCTRPKGHDGPCAAARVV